MAYLPVGTLRIGRFLKSVLKSSHDVLCKVNKEAIIVPMVDLSKIGAESVLVPVITSSAGGAGASTYASCGVPNGEEWEILSACWRGTANATSIFIVDGNVVGSNGMEYQLPAAAAAGELSTLLRGVPLRTNWGFYVTAAGAGSFYLYLIVRKYKV